MQKTDGIGNRKIKAIFFDMDNTLFDFVEAKLRACRAVVECVGKNDDDDLVEYFLKDPIDIENLDCIARYLKDRELYCEETYENCVNNYQDIKLGELRIYNGVEKTLEKLRNTDLKLVVITDAFEDNALARLKKTNLLQYFDLIVTADMVGKKKPEPDSLLYAIKKLKVNRDEVILVGDSIRRDIEPAKKLGLLTVYAAYGDRNFQENMDCSADYSIHNIEELIDIIDIYNRQKELSD